ncbi:MAG: hypothetical protein ABI222_18235, partial [Opitutaceae bacterium]
MSAPARPIKSSAATLIAAALVVMPFLQALDFDFDRCGAFVLLLPALWAGRVELAQALARLRAGPLWLKYSAALASLSLIPSIIVAGQIAPALVTAASWVILGAA